MSIERAEASVCNVLKQVLKMVDFNCCCRDPSLLELLDWGQLRRTEGNSYLLKVDQLVSQLRGKRFVNRSGSRLRIAGIDDTIYRESDEKMDDWGMFYLPQVVNMCVFGVVEDTPYKCDQFVLMTCEDKKVYGYDGKDLHEVASDLKKLWDEGLDYPASKSYHMETFKDIVISKKLTSMETFLVQQEAFRYNAVMIIRHMLYWSKYTPESKHLVDEILHSIFFLGEINKPKHEPKDIVDDEMLNMLKGQYPRSLECYRTHVPKRSPFSCVLDMIVLKIKQTQVDKIKKRLQKLSSRLQLGFLASTTMCVTTYNNCNYYGVSMSTKNIRNAAKIMIAASCLSSWEEYVAAAVMTYYLEKTNKKSGETKKDFDGTIKLPASVTCVTFNIKSQTKMEPCTFCSDLFGLSTTETVPPTKWKHGNCAEVESVSNLFKNQKAVKEAVRPTSPTYTAENQEKAVGRVHEVLRSLLLQVNFQWWFYEPQIHLS